MISFKTISKALEIVHIEETHYFLLKLSRSFIQPNHISYSTFLGILHFYHDTIYRSLSSLNFKIIEVNHCIVPMMTFC